MPNYYNWSSKSNERHHLSPSLSDFLLLLFPVFSPLDSFYSATLYFYFLSVTSTPSLTFLSCMLSFLDFFFSYRILISHVLFISTFPSGYFYPSSYCFIIFSFLFIISLPSFRFPFFYLSSHSTSLVK